MNLKRLTYLLVAACCALPAVAQEKLHPDTLQCPIVGFHVGTLSPWSSLSSAKNPAGNAFQNATMGELYEAPWLDFGADVSYKFKDGLLLNLDGSLVFGNDNLKKREERMSDLYTSGHMIIGANGTDAKVTCHNRMLAMRLGIGKIFVTGKNNPNSGPFVRLDAGIMQQQTIFTLNEQVNAPQVNGDYGLLYDHQRFGFTLTQVVGFWYMGNKSAILNFHVAIEITECWSHSTRDYVIDDLIRLRGPDKGKYFDLLYGLRLTWMFPITGKTAYDYYYY
ncbi:MAG: hypothetical protein SPJ13_08490 [Bacteroidales bacterium]|nr:hypothetical protein [Bacteroidales bacterium]